MVFVFGSRDDRSNGLHSGCRPGAKKELGGAAADPINFSAVVEPPRREEVRLVGVEKSEGVRRELEGAATDTGNRGDERDVVLVSGRNADRTRGLDSDSVGLNIASSLPPQFISSWFISDFMFSAPALLLALVFKNL